MLCVGVAHIDVSTYRRQHAAYGSARARADAWEPGKRQRGGRGRWHDGGGIIRCISHGDGELIGVVGSRGV
eukprot:scaffold14068_cov119-Isochrysis_galbana.AAC.9